MIEYKIRLIREHFMPLFCKNKKIKRFSEFSEGFSLKKLLKGSVMGESSGFC